MKVGIVIPQGWVGEYAGLDPERAWVRMVQLAARADGLGFDSIWLFDHVHPEQAGPAPTFEAFTALAALATATRRVRLGHLVTCAAYRNPALLAKMVATLDVISGGRMELGLGAGWKREEYEAYGWPFLPTRDRLALLEETLVVARKMLREPGPATYLGERVSVADAWNEPRPLQPALPILVGGNGRNVTWRLAARYADELNLDSMAIDEWREARADLDRRCEEVGRARGTLRTSIHVWWPTLEAAPSRADLLRAWADEGMDRAMVLIRGAARDPGELDRFAEECLGAGLELDDGTSAAV